MAAYRQVDDLRSLAGWLPVHRDQLRAQCSVSSMEKPLPLPFCVVRGLGIFRNESTSLWDLDPNSGLSRLFCFYTTARQSLRVSSVSFDSCKFVTLSTHLCLHHIGSDTEHCTVRLQQLRLVINALYCRKKWRMHWRQCASIMIRFR